MAIYIERENMTFLVPSSSGCGVMGSKSSLMAVLA